jgi:uncharacterized protein
MCANEIGRRSFLRKVSSVLLGVSATRLWDVETSPAWAENAPTPEHRILGRTGLRVTSVGMGVMNCSDPAVIHRAFDLGINFYDTAPSYMRGRNEEMVGKALQGRREKVFIQTKLHFGEEKKMRTSVETSLRRLQTDHIDVLLWHGLTSAEEVSNPRSFEFTEKMKKEGKIRFSGFSAHSRMAALLREAAKTAHHDVALVSYNFTHSKDLREAIGQAAKSGIGIVAMKTQAGGYKKEKMGILSPHQAALKYVLNDRNVTLAIPGVTTIGEIEECASVMGTILSQRDADCLRQYHSFLQGRTCTQCGGCDGACPHGVPYDRFLRAMMYWHGYEDHRLAADALGETPGSLMTERCAECASCSVVCRRGVDIRAQIGIAHRMIS